MKKQLLVIISALMFSALSFGQQQLVTGTVTGDDGSPLPGAAVLIKGTSIGITTDIDGNYSIDVTGIDNPVLVFSFVGYLSKEAVVGNQQVINITLVSDIKSLEEVVVVGYGTQKKSLVTGSIAKVNAKDIENSVSTRFEQAIQGKTSGLVVAQNSGAPGSGLTIKIRGNSSDGKNNPLYIVDGVKTGGLEYLNPMDIESVEVLKDAASAAIYGAEGGNGVILITTKKGKQGTAVLQYQFLNSMQEATNLPKSMTGPEYRHYFMEAATWENNAKNYALFSALDSTTSTNWVDEIFQKAPMQQHQLSFSGGSEKTTYFMSASYLDQDGIIGGPKNNFTRYTFRSNVETRLKKWVTFGTHISYTRDKKNNLNATNEYGGIINNAITYDPTIPVVYNSVNDILPQYLNDSLVMAAWNRRSSDGKYYTKSGLTAGEAWNPVAQIDASHDKQTQDKVVADMYADLKPVSWAKLTSRIYVDYAYQKHDIFTGKNFYGVDPLTADSNTNVNQSWDRWYKYGIENYATFDKQFGDHSFQIMVGQSYENYAHYWLNVIAYYMRYASIDFAYPGQALPAPNLNYIRYTVTDQSTNTPEVDVLASYFGRFVYNYKEKIMLQGSFRRDGSSNFGSDEKYASFPSFSAGYTISKEDFFSGISQALYLDNLKLRASWGRNGSRQNLNSFPFVSTMTTVYYSNYSPSGSLELGAVPGVPANNALKWETSQQTDVGADLGFFRNSLTLSIDWYKKSTIDQLAPKSDQPYYLGFQGNSTVNSGEVENKGWEFDLGYRGNAGDLKYNVSFNASYLKNKVVDYGVPDGKDGANIGQLGVVNRYDIGQPVWYYYGYKAIGIFQTQEEIDNYVNDKGVKLQPSAKPGDVKFADLPVDSTGVPDGVLNDNDKTFLGKPMPDWTFGLSLGCEYKGFDLNVFFQGVTGNQIYWAGYRNDRKSYNRAEMWYNERWKGPGTSTKYPRASYVDANNNFRVSSLNVYDGNYLRLKSLTLGYTIPSNLTKKINITTLRVFYTATNLMTWTKYPGTDPEVGMYDTENNYSYGVDKGLYPPTKINTVGVTVTF